MDDLSILDQGIATPQHNKYMLLNNGTGHEHTVTLLNGKDGMSSQAAGHVHNIVNGIVQPAFGHTHKLGAWEGFSGGPGINKLLVVIVLLLVVTSLRV